MPDSRKPKSATGGGKGNLAGKPAGWWAADGSDLSHYTVFSQRPAAFENAREESDHIYSFCKEVGIGYLSKATLSATDVWERLRQWYIGNGTLEVKDLGDGKTKETWNNQTTWGDHTVKGLNQILPRLLKIFPKATRARDNQGRNCLEGIGFLPPDSGGGGGDSGGGGGDSGGGSPPNPPNSTNGNSVSVSNNSEAVLNVSEAGLNQFNPNSSNGSEPTEANPAISRVKNLWSVLTEEERMQLLQELGLEKNSGADSSNQLQLVHNPDAVSNTVSSGDVQAPSVQVQKPPTPPTTVEALVNQILLCQTWVAVASTVDRDGDKLKKAANRMTLEQRQGLTTLLAAHLCSNPSDLNQLAWVPARLRVRALERLSFTIRRLGGGENVLDACIEYISGCKFVSVEHLGERYERWVFSTPAGKNIPVFGTDAIEAIALS